MSAPRFEHAPRVLAAAALAIAPLVICVAALAAWPSAARADRPGATMPAAPAADVALWREECGACHVAYPARLLSADDWRRVMGRLDGHYGADASLDAAGARRIEALLVAGARGAERGRTAPSAGAAPASAAPVPATALPRITTARWFVREHDEVPARVWKDPRVGSAARCESCHVDAASGRFDEERIRWPVSR